MINDKFNAGLEMAATILDEMAEKMQRRYRRRALAGMSAEKCNEMIDGYGTLRDAAQAIRDEIVE